MRGRTSGVEGAGMSSSVISTEQVCALHGCTNPVEPVLSGEPRRYCCPEHRKMARKRRRNEAPEGAQSRDEPAIEHSARSSAPRPGSVGQGDPARSSTAGNGERDRGEQPTTTYRRLVPEPRPRWFRRRASRPYATRGVRPVRRDARLDPFTLPDWLRPAPAHAPSARAKPPHGEPPPARPPSLRPQPPAPVPPSPALPSPVPPAPPAIDDVGAAIPAPGNTAIPATVPTRPSAAATTRRTDSARTRLALPASAATGAAPPAPKASLQVGRWLDGPVETCRYWMAGHREQAAARHVEKAVARADAAAVLTGVPLPLSGHEHAAGGPRVAVALRAAATRAATPAELRNAVAVWAPQMREALIAALRSLSNNRLRSLLTTTGIVVGVAAVIVLVALGNGMKANFDRQFSRLANQIIIASAKGSVPDGRMPRHLTDQDVAAMSDRQRAPDVADVSPAMQGNVVVTAGQAKDNASLVGATENYLDMQNRRVASGRWFTAAQISGGERGVVVGQQALHLLWDPGTSPDSVIGKPIRLGHSTFKIQGVLAADGQNDNAVIVPLAATRAYLLGNNGGEVSQITVRSTSVATLGRAVTELTAILDTQHLIHSPTSRDFTVTTFTELLNQSTQFINFLTMFIVAVAAISLFVGGVGVANIMLVSVTERTREIGIRKAVGAKTTAILRQFLSEAVMLTGLGGLVGVILGVLVTVGGAAVLPSLVPAIPIPILTLSPVVIAFSVSLAIGLLAGGYPANRAARLRPIEALRFE